MKYLKKSYPKDFSFISSKLTKKIFKEKGFKETKIIRDWKNVVGEEISNYTTPIGISNNKVLKVLCDSIFAIELQHITPKVLSRINLIMGYKAIEKIYIVQTTNIKNKTKKKNIKQKLTKKETDNLDNIINEINNKKLKEKLKNLSETLFLKNKIK